MSSTKHVHGLCWQPILSTCRFWFCLLMFTITFPVRHAKTWALRVVHRQNCVLLLQEKTTKAYTRQHNFETASEIFVPSYIWCSNFLMFCICLPVSYRVGYTQASIVNMFTMFAICVRVLPSVCQMCSKILSAKWWVEAENEKHINIKDDDEQENGCNNEEETNQESEEDKGTDDGDENDDDEDKTPTNNFLTSWLLSFLPLYRTLSATQWHQSTQHHDFIVYKRTTNINDIIYKIWCLYIILVTFDIK